MVAFSGCKAVDHLIDDADQCDLSLILLSFPFGLEVIYKCVGDEAQYNFLVIDVTKSPTVFFVLILNLQKHGL